MVCLSADLRLGPILAGCVGGQPSTSRRYYDNGGQDL